MIAQLIREAVRSCLAEENPAGLLFGKVTTEAPLTVSVENKLILSGSRLILPREFQKRSLTLTFGKETKEILLYPGLHKGDSVILVRMGDCFRVAGTLETGEQETL